MRKKRYKVVRPDVECPVCQRWVKGIRIVGDRNKYAPWPHTDPSTCTPCVGRYRVARKVVQL